MSETLQYSGISPRSPPVLAEHVSGVTADNQKNDNLLPLLSRRAWIASRNLREGTNEAFWRMTSWAVSMMRMSGIFWLSTRAGREFGDKISRFGIVQGFERGRGGAEDDGGVFDFARAHHGDVAAGVAQDYSSCL